MHLTSASGGTPVRQAVNNNESGLANPQLQRDLQLFSSRLSKKLQKATHVVLELRELLRYNLTKVWQYSYDDEDEEESELDLEMEMEDLHARNTASPSMDRLQLYLNSQIESCQPDDYETELDAVAGSSPSAQSIHYNKQQIQILNYLKSDDARVTFLNENNARSLAVNGYISEQLLQLKRRLSRSDADNSNAKPSSGNHFKHIYFLSNSDGASASLHFRQLYVSAIKQKYVLLLIDVGSALNAELFELTKNFVHEMLQLLEDTDKISLVTVSSEASFMSLEAFPSEAGHGIYSATRGHKEEIISYINNLSRAQALTNHSLGFEYAFELLHRLQQSGMINTAEQPVEFVYVTRGLLTNLSDAMAVLRVVAEGQRRLKAPVIINTCAVVLDEKRIMYEKQFLSDVATQNYTKYEIDVTSWWPSAGQQASRLAGRFFVLSKLHAETSLPQTSSRIFGQLFQERYLTDTLEVHPPVVDADSGGECRIYEGFL